MLKAVVCLLFVLSLSAPAFAQGAPPERESKLRSANIKIWIGVGSLVTGASFIWAANQRREFEQPEPFSNRTITLSGGGWEKGTLAFGLASAGVGGWFLHKGLKERREAKAAPSTTFHAAIWRGSARASVVRAW